ncbi:MAG: polyketide synthase dehydratase domain-containing protein, partial [Myxococcota bacterium]
LRVLRGVSLENPEVAQHLLVRVRSLEKPGHTPGNTGVVEVEVALPGESTPRYSARVLVDDGPSTAISLVSEAAPATETAMVQEGVSMDGVYGSSSPLFHGPAFHVLGSVEALPVEQVLRATVSGVDGMRWRGERWCCDVAVLDGALQLGVLQGARVLDGANLPTLLSAVDWAHEGALETPVHAVLRRTEHSAHRIAYRVDLMDRQGDLVATVAAENHLLLSQEGGEA